MTGSHVTAGLGQSGQQFVVELNRLRLIEAADGHVSDGTLITDRRLDLSGPVTDCLGFRSVDRDDLGIRRLELYVVRDVELALGSGPGDDELVLGTWPLQIELRDVKDDF